MTQRLFVIALLLLLVRGLTILLYRGTNYYYGMVAMQFAIAEAAYQGHWFSQDETRVNAVSREASQTRRFIPIEDWKNYPHSGRYTTFPPKDLPGYGYLMALTSQCVGRELTSRYAFAVQILLEMVSVLLFVYCVSLPFGERVAFASGLIYVFGYPFIWALASQPMRDIFVMGVYSLYITAFFVFSRRGDDVWSFLILLFLVATSALLLWVRPSGYYFFFMVAPLIFFVKNKSRASRVRFFLTTVLLPMLLFGYPLRRFNLKHYGVANTHAVAIDLWEGMGVIENRYGFVEDDSALQPWVKSQGYNVEAFSPEMNRVLWDSVVQVIREDPVFYLRTVLAKCLAVVKQPLQIYPPRSLTVAVSYKKSGLSLAEYVERHPRNFAFKVLSGIYAVVFFHGGLILSVIMWIRRAHLRLELLVLLSPLLYFLPTQMLIHFEQRYLAPVTWVLVLPWAWWLCTRKKTAEGGC